MKHVVLTNAWEFGNDPFPAYRVNLVYGRNKRNRSFLPVKEVIPILEDDTLTPILPQDKFRVIKTKEKGTILIVPGSDTTNRCLLFVGCAGGFRGGVRILAEGTNAKILKECSAGNNCDSSVEVAAILEVGQSVVFYTYGRRTNEVHKYTWDGMEVKKTLFSKSEWDCQMTPVEEAEAEVL